MSTRNRAERRSPCAIGLLLAGLGLPSACVESASPGEPSSAGSAGAGAVASAPGTAGAGGSQAGAAGGPGTGRVPGPASQGTWVDGVCRGDDPATFCRGDLPCPSLREARATDPADLERPCQGADGSPRILRYSRSFFSFETQLFDGSGALVGMVHGYTEPGAYCRGTSYAIHQGDTAGNCRPETPSWEGCPRSDAGEVARPCVLTVEGPAD